MATIVLCSDILPTRPLVDLPTSAQEVFGLAAAADFSLGNFEVPLTRRGAPLHKLLNIRADPAIARSVPATGVSMMSLANNHAIDYGWDGLSDTIAGLGAAGVETIGGGETLEVASRPAFRRVDGAVIGVVAFSCLTPTGMGASLQRPGISPLHVHTAYEIDPLYQLEEPGDASAIAIRTRVADADLERALGQVRAVRQQCDLLLVTIHWGFGSGETLAEYQEPLAHSLIEAGADLVHGHHPHAIHGFGFHRGKPIIYSAGTMLGQQIFLDAPQVAKDLWAGMSPDGYLTRFRFENGEISNLELIPTTLDADRLPRLAEGANFHAIRQRLERLSRPRGAEIGCGNGTLHPQPLPF